jgi:hypothetical protein
MMPYQKDKFDKFTAKNNSNYLGSVEYINGLFNRYERLLVIRLDLGYRQESEGRSNALRCRYDFERFQNNQKNNPLFGTLVGNIWSLEYHPINGFQYQCILFFNGFQSYQDTNLGHSIGQYWIDISKGDGIYWNGNDKQSDYTWNGLSCVGMIGIADEQLIIQLLDDVLPYLTMPDYQIRQYLHHDGWHWKTFGRGMIHVNRANTTTGCHVSL